MTLNFQSSCLHPLSVEITGIHHYAQCGPCWGLNPGLYACCLSTLTTKLQRQCKKDDFKRKKVVICSSLLLAKLLACILCISMVALRRYSFCYFTSSGMPQSVSSHPVGWRAEEKPGPQSPVPCHSQSKAYNTEETGAGVPGHIHSGTACPSCGIGSS